MKAIISPSVSNGSVRIPSSKSMGHRALICAALSDESCIVSNVDFSDDIIATINSLKALGAGFDINGNTIKVTPIKVKTLNEATLNANESGSTLRFLIPLASYYAKEVKFYGTKKLLSRPLDMYENLYNNQNLIFNKCTEYLNIKGSLKAGTYNIDTVVSSQFISGLLYLLPLLKDDSTIIINNKFESKSYVVLTLQMLEYFGIKINVNEDLTRFDIKGSQKYFAKDYSVESDFSQAAFFLALGTINNDITLLGLNNESNQGDKVIVDIVKNLGGNVEDAENKLIVKRVETSKDAIIDIHDCPDLGPILTVLLSVNKGNSTITNAARLRLKESDRILAMETELKKFGIDISSDENNIYIKGQNEFSTNAELESHNDHRIFMSLAILSTIAKSPVIINGVECINKSYPNFIEDLKKLQIKVELINE